MGNDSGRNGCSARGQLFNGYARSRWAGNPSRGVYLDVIKDERLVFTDAYTKAWEPSEKPFMTVTVTFESEDGATRYTARAVHWTVADREEHEKMGFHEGWGKCAEQLADLVMKGLERKG
ncbi:MAG: SRPBCC domain-containing protein [Chlorobiales bacterium]|nr:SRPBCC domain-containing protein [Chlorobiales bacterium]